MAAKTNKKASAQDDPETPYYDARDSDGHFTAEQEAAHPVVIEDNAKANEEVEAKIVAAQWQQAKALGLLDREGGINENKPKDL